MKFFDGEFFKNFKTVLIGSSLDKILLILSVPLIMRLYDPKDLAIFSLYTSLVSVFASIGCFKLENLIVITKDDKKITEIIFFCVLSAIICSFIAYVILLSLEHYEINFIQELKDYLVIIVLSILFSCLYQIYSHLFIRFSQFKKFNILKISQTVSFLFALTLLYLFKFNINGIIISYFIGYIVCFIYGYNFYKIKFLKIKIYDFFKFIKKNKNLTFYDSSSSLFYTIGNEVPVFFLSIYYNNLILGYYALVNKIFLLPISVLSRAVGTANYKHLTELVHSNKLIFNYIFKLTITLLSITIIPVILCFSFSEIFITMVFGDKWLYSAKILEILCIAFGFKFVALTLFETAYPVKLIKTLSLWKYLSTFSIIIILYPTLNFFSVNDTVFFFMLGSIELFNNLVLITIINYKCYTYDKKRKI